MRIFLFAIFIFTLNFAQVIGTVKELDLNAYLGEWYKNINDILL